MEAEQQAANVQAYDQSSPMPNKLLQPDGSVSTLDGSQVVSPADPGRAAKYVTSDPTANKVLNPDGSVGTLPTGAPPGGVQTLYPNNKLDTVYQNTSGSFKMVAVTSSVVNIGNCYAYSDTMNPPEQLVDVGSAPVAVRSVTFGVPDGYYYMVHDSDGAAATVSNWAEWSV